LNLYVINKILSEVSASGYIDRRGPGARIFTSYS
jgi:hypothetical protein